MKKILRLCSALLTAAMLTLPTAARPVTVSLSGETVSAGQTRLIENSTYVPLRSFCAALGVNEVVWDADSGTAVVTAPGLTIRAAIGAVWIEVNGRAFHAPDGVKLVDGVMMIPVRPLARAFGLEVDWDGETSTANLTPTGSGWAAEASSVYDSDDLYWLSRIISAESRGEPLAGQLAVGNVVLNRVASPEFPNTIYDVIFDRKYAIQFTPVANGTIYQTPAESSVIAAKLALEGYTVSSSVLYFLNPDLSTSFWIPQNRTYAFRIGTHEFYT
ncbi:MAG: cell wall hydrolase [Clostridia bacterium]|nr:cell wall hydrolase [Clostridia bacterium]